MYYIIGNIKLKSRFEEKRDIEISRFDPAGFEPTHVPEKGLSS